MRSDVITDHENVVKLFYLKKCLLQFAIHTSRSHSQYSVSAFLRPDTFHITTSSLKIVFKTELAQSIDVTFKSGILK